LTVHTLDQDFSLRRRLNLDAVRHFMNDRVRKPERQIEFGALGLSLVTNADKRELLLEPLGHSDDHVAEEGPHGAGHGRTIGLVFDGCTL